MGGGGCARTRGMGEWLATLLFGYGVLDWTLRLVMLPVVAGRHRAGPALAWLAVVFLQPVVGTALYLLLGRQLLGVKRVQSHDNATERVMTGERMSVQEPHEMELESVPWGYRDFVRLARRVARQPALAGNSAELVGEHGAFVDALVERIDRAERSVHLMYYVVKDDATLRRVIGSLRSAADRGVRVVLMADAVGSKPFLKSEAARELGRLANVEVRPMMQVRLLRAQFARVDVRNHRKLAVIDGREAVTGSHNLCDPDYGGSSYGPWVDLSVAARGPIVYQLQLLFLEDYVYETGELPERMLGTLAGPERAGEVSMQAVPSGPSAPNEGFRELIVSAINEANERVVMTTPYFVPDEAALLALRLRALAGLDVEIIVPERVDSVLVSCASRVYLRDLLRAGARVHLHGKGLLHAKTLLIDDRFALIGSGNFDRRSFAINYELNTLCSGREVVSSLERVYEGYLAESRELTLEELERRPRWRRTRDDLATLLSPLL